MMSVPGQGDWVHRYMLPRLYAVPTRCRLAVRLQTGLVGTAGVALASDSGASVASTSPATNAWTLCCGGDQRHWMRLHHHHKRLLSLCSLSFDNGRTAGAPQLDRGKVCHVAAPYGGTIPASLHPLAAVSAEGLGASARFFIGRPFACTAERPGH